MIRWLLLLCTLAWPVTRSHQDLINLAGRKGDITHLYDLYNRAGCITPQEFGANATDTLDDRAAIQAAINAAAAAGGVVFLPAGTYYQSGPDTLKAGVTLAGAGMGATVLYASSSSIYQLVTPAPATASLTQTNTLKVGDTVHSITNTLTQGQVVWFQSSTRFTAEWDGGVAIRATYTNGEILRVRKASGASVTFDEGAALEYLSAATTGVTAWTPNRNIRVSDLTLSRATPSHGTLGGGLLLRYCDGAQVERVQTLNTNDYGIAVAHSLHASLRDIYTRGDTATSGTNYGISIDGSKHVSISHTFHAKHRHGIAGGGSNICPMYVQASGVHVEDSRGDNQSIDVHGNGFRWTYENCFLDWGLQISGIGHVVRNVHSLNGEFYLYEGGTDLTLENVSYARCNRIYSNKEIHRVTIRNSTFNLLGYTDNIWKAGSTDITLDGVRLINKGLDTATSNAAADSTIPSGQPEGVNLYTRGKLLNSHIQGFPIGAFIGEPDVTVENTKFVNCGWNSSRTTSDAVLRITKGGEGAAVRNIKVEYTHASVSNTTVARVVYLENAGSGGADKILISDVQFSKAHSSNYAVGLEIGAGYSELEVANLYLAGSNSITGYIQRKVGTVLEVTGAGSPESNVTAPIGSRYSRTDGGAGTALYVKESGAGNTGWVGK